MSFGCFLGSPMRRLAYSYLFCALLLQGNPQAAIAPGVQNAFPMDEWELQAGSSGRIMTPEGAAVGIDNPAGGGESTLLSRPIPLEVGCLYRLKARVRAEGVRLDQGARYPTARGACLSMESTPFTNASASLAASNAGDLSLLFFAVQPTDRIRLHLGKNGKASGKAWFDAVSLEKVEDLQAIIPPETLRWSGNGFRYDEGGWKFVHVEGTPYERGFQQGELLASDVESYIQKLAYKQNDKDPLKGWNDLRFQCDALFLRKFSPEFLEEMKGLAVGAHRGGARFRGRELDLQDIVVLNTIVELGQLSSALKVTPTALTGRQLGSPEVEAQKAGEGDHCSSFVATQSATTRGDMIFTQMFMWNGYTGVHWDVMLDVKPSQGKRFVMQTFPGGIHSGSDWMINEAGLAIGETTVGQTPFDPDGLPMAERSRRAIQYAGSIDEAVKLLKTRNNGLYSNDWTMADFKTGEGACLLLGTKASKLWRTGNSQHPADTPGKLKDFIWANNNERDPEVRKELAASSDDAPQDLAFFPMNRDVSFWQAYEKLGKGGFNLDSSLRLLASSPINRAHACDAKLTTTDMAKKLMFMAHYGKTTHREKWVGGRWIPDQPGAIPHLTLGTTTFNPLWVTEQVQKLPPRPEKKAIEPLRDCSSLKELLSFDKELLWKNTIYPATEGDNWFNTASAAYHDILKHLPSDPAKAFDKLSLAMGDLRARYNYLLLREADLTPAQGRTAYGTMAPYWIPRIKGVALLHQLRAELGNGLFSKVMNAVHNRFAFKAMGTEDFLRVASETAGRDLAPLVRSWLAHASGPLPSKAPYKVQPKDGSFELTAQLPAGPFPLHTSLEITTERGVEVHPVRLGTESSTWTHSFKSEPRALRLHALHELPAQQDSPFTYGNLLDDFSKLLLVWGTQREIEAQRSLALNWREVMSDGFWEHLPPVLSDGEVKESQCMDHDLVIFGGVEDNALLSRLPKAIPGLETGRNWFRYKGQSYTRPEDGLFLALPNPWNPKRSLYLFVANSRLQMWRMTKSLQRGLPGWALFKEGEVVAKGHHE